MPGSRVWHLAYGAGTVEALIAGRRTRVRFDGASELPRTVMRGELRMGRALDVEAEAASALLEPQPIAVGSEAVAPAARLRVVPPAPRRATTRARRIRSEPGARSVVELRGEVGDLRQTLEALRLGVVPARFVEEYTVGRERELTDIGTMLELGHGFRAIWGDYGAGKTHLLDVVEQLALQRGFATCRIVIDPIELPPTHPKRLYAAILRGLRLPESAGVGFDSLALSLCESPEHRLPTGASFSEFFSPYLHALHAHDPRAIETMRDYVAGEEIDRDRLVRALSSTRWRGAPPLVLSDYRTYGRIYMHLLGTIATWIRDAGHRGLVLLLDEVEYVHSLTSLELGYALEVLKHFAAVTLPRSALGFDPDDPRELYRGGQAVHRAVPLRFRADQPLSVVLALTPLEEVLALYAGVVRDPSLSITLQPLVSSDFMDLTRRVAALYRRGYPQVAWSASGVRRQRDRVLGHDDDASTVRTVVQRMVHALDELRYPGWSSHGA